MALVSTNGGVSPDRFPPPGLPRPLNTTAAPSVSAVASARPRPSQLSEPVRRIVRDELRRQRLTRSYFVGVGLADGERRDLPTVVEIIRDGTGRVVEAQAGSTRYSIERTPDGLVYRVTEVRAAEGREVVWLFQRGYDVRIARVVPTVRELPVEEVEVGP